MTPNELEEALKEVYKDDPRRNMAEELATLRAKVDVLTAEVAKNAEWQARAVASMDAASLSAGVICCDQIPEAVDKLTAEVARLRGALKQSDAGLSAALTVLVDSEWHATFTTCQTVRDYVQAAMKGGE